MAGQSCLAHLSIYRSKQAKIKMKKNIVLYIATYLLVIIYIMTLIGCEAEITPPEDGNPYVKRQTLELSSSERLNYVILFPESYDSTLSYPALLALPPGSQSINEVEWAINLYYIRQSIQQNWIVINPIAPEDKLFHEGSEVYIPILLDEVEKSLKIEGDKFHLAGISSGGISGFRLATVYPERFQSLTVFPGLPLESDQKHLDRLVDMSITMYVGENDASEWVNGTEQTAHELDSLGVTVSYKIWANDGHVITSLNPEFLFDLFETYRKTD